MVGAFSVAFYLVEIFAERNQASTAFSTEMERVRADIRRRLQYYENTAFSKRYLEARLDEEVKRSRRYRLPLTLLLLTVGVRPQGKDWDDIAAAVISTSSKVLRSEDVLGYLGESHFALILPHTARNQAGVVAGRLAAGLRDCDPTFGLAEIDDHATTGQDLVKSAQADLEAAFLGHLKCTLWNEAAQLD